MKIEIHNDPLDEEYEKFKKLCPNAKEKIYPDGSRSLIVERDGEQLFHLDYIKKGELSERDLFTVSKWGIQPTNMEDLVNAYNKIMPYPEDKIDLDMAKDQGKYFYKVNKGKEFLEGTVMRLQESNPDIEISGRFLKKNHMVDMDTVTIVSSKPLEELKEADYYKSLIGKLIIPETYEEYASKKEGDFLNYNVTELSSKNFVEALKRENPGKLINLQYDKDGKAAKIVSSSDLSELKLPGVSSGMFGIDKDGNLGYLNDQEIEYKTTKANGFGKSEYREEQKRYFGSISKNNVVQKDSQQEKVQVSNEQRKFTIRQREKAMSDAQKAKNRSAIVAGVCILGAAAAALFSGQDFNQVLQHELSTIYSSQLGQAGQNMGIVTTMLAAGAGAFIAKYCSSSKNMEKAKNDLIYLNSSIGNTQTRGGEENARTR